MHQIIHFALCTIVLVGSSSLAFSVENTNASSRATEAHAANAVRKENKLTGPERAAVVKARNDARQAAGSFGATRSAEVKVRNAARQAARGVTETVVAP